MQDAVVVEHVEENVDVMVLEEVKEIEELHDNQKENNFYL